MNPGYRHPSDMSHHGGMPSASYPTPPSNGVPTTPTGSMHPYAQPHQHQHQHQHQQQPPPPPLPPLSAVQPPQHHQQLPPPPIPPIAQLQAPPAALQQQQPPLQHQHHHQHHQQHPLAQQQQPQLHRPPPPASLPRTDEPPGALVHAEHGIAIGQSQLSPESHVEDGSGRRYHLDVVQQPKRARMCGYGDKDRRPITPPPCVRLVITSIETGEEISCKEIDYSMFVLNVDLWDENGSQEVNLCRQPSSTGAPAIAATATYSYAPINGGEPAASQYASPAIQSSRDGGYGQPPPVGYAQEYHPQQGYNHASPSYPPNGTYGPPQQFFPQHQAPSMATQRYESNGSAMGYVEAGGSSVYVHDQYKGALNRNLIGSVSASAFGLTDTTDREGVWFVLQDLSVRLEGTYRLRFSFVNVGTAGGGSRDRNPAVIVKGKVPILASCFSDKFNVFSAKKFPGVCESTPLSKTFATQGIKIPIRKDGAKGGDDDDDGD